MIERDDFTNFLVFFDQFHQNTSLLQKIESFDSNLFREVAADDKTRYLLRFLYCLIYEIQNYSEEKANENSQEEYKKENNEVSQEINEISEKIKEQERIQGNIFEDNGPIIKDDNKTPSKNDIKVNEPQKQVNSEEKGQDWEIDDKLLIFS